ncbi:hypothetical protein [Flavilitoribacter nigricans]|uniref:Uncharacterized protein n=1 Tax=Flavilitoribacter nigricans (strain ATCC 23147 / DSM 23189 / NBRC 102662 / NCIMB 1420 / SS-2) TaxID=1122177 RepID=A0A2D0NCS2_FLAN2|nr:hypothetical protein [Flavilitoribacter nigricans]PHN06166.1 hypothetical protein CRP01_11315 [Flavilitoribacter nigricans DSM 23189 = NBRC 102662]
MDPVSAIANAVGQVFGPIFSRKRRGDVPDWLSPKDFQVEDNTPVIILGAGSLILIIIIIAIMFKK